MKCEPHKALDVATCIMLSEGAYQQVSDLGEFLSFLFAGQSVKNSHIRIHINTTGCLKKNTKNSAEEFLKSMKTKCLQFVLAQ